MKKLIKFYQSTNPKLSEYKFGNYGSLEKILKEVVCGNGFYEVAINKIELLADKKIKFYFETSNADGYYFKKYEVVNIKGVNDEEYVIIEATTEYILCEYYEDYTVTSMEVFDGHIVLSSLGFKEHAKDSVTGKYTIKNEEENFYYHFYDIESDGFLNSDPNKIVGVYMQSADDLSLVVPSNITTTDYNNLPSWNTMGSTPYKRRCIHNMFYTSLSNFTIIGNGNFVFLIVTFQYSYLTSMIYCFGKFKSYLENYQNNSLLVSADVYNTSVNFGTATNNSGINSSNVRYRFGNRSFGVNISPFYRTSGNISPSSTVNTICTQNTTIPTSFADSTLITRHVFNANLLHGYNYISAFHLTPKKYLGNLVATNQPSLYKYPNYDNKMYVSEINITGVIDSDNYVYDYGLMPFMLCWGHDASSIPNAESTFIMRHENNESKYVYSHNSNPASPAYNSGAWLFDITPKNYILYNNYDS